VTYDDGRVTEMLIESTFRVQNITIEEVKFDVIMSVLPQASLQLVLEVIEHPHSTSPYTTLKNRLMSAHKLSSRGLRHCSKWSPLGPGSPPNYWHRCWNCALGGKEKSPFFIFLFLQRLPKELCVLLSDEAPEEPR
jgi:hypothetical protein